MSNSTGREEMSPSIGRVICSVQGKVVSADDVNHPTRYNKGGVECIDALKSATVGKTGIEAVCVANVIKYLWRYEEKDGRKDILKAQWYLNRLLEEVK